MCYASTPNSVFKSGLPKWLRTYLTNQYVILRYCSPSLCKWNYLYSNLPFYKTQAIVLWPGMNHPVPKLSQNALYGWGRVLFLLPSDVYVRSFLHLLYTLIKLYYTHTQKKNWTNSPDTFNMVECLYLSPDSVFQQAAKMKSLYFVAGLFVMLVQGSWQRSLQNTEEKSRY